MEDNDNGGVVPDDPEKIERLAGHVRGLLDELGLDRRDPNLEDTDRRVAKMYLEMFHGLSEGSQPKVTTFPRRSSGGKRPPAPELKTRRPAAASASFER